MSTVRSALSVPVAMAASVMSPSVTAAWRISGPGGVVKNFHVNQNADANDDCEHERSDEPPHRGLSY